MFFKHNINLYTTSNSNPEEWQPKEIFLGKPSEGNLKWYHEIWESTKVIKGVTLENTSLDKAIYYKRKTLEDCYKKYGIVRRSNPSEYFKDYERHSDIWVYDAPSSEPIPLLWELEAKTPNILYDSEGQQSPFRIKFYTFSDKSLPNTPQSLKVIRAIKDYLKEVPITGVAESLFGNSKYVVQAYQARNGWQVQRLYSEGKDWKIQVGGNTTSESKSILEGVSLSATFSGLWLEDLTIVLGNKHVSQLNRTFQSIRRDNRHALRVNVVYADSVDKKYPHYTSNSQAGFVPLNFIGVFLGCAIEQESLNNILKNTDFRYCRNFANAFSDLNDFNGECATKVGYAYNASDSNPDTLSNTWYPNKHPMSDSFMFKNTHDDITLYCGNLFRTFYKSRFTVVKPIIDCTYMHDRMQEGRFDGTFFNEENWGTRAMVDIRLRNIGNFQDLYFDGRGGENGNNTTKFNKESITYLLSNLRNQTKYIGDTQEDYNRTKCLYPTCTLHIPQAWVDTLGEDKDRYFQVARDKGWVLKINDQIVN